MKVAVGVDLGGTNMRVGLVSEDGQLLGSLKTKTPTESGPEATAQEMAKLIRELVDKHPQHKALGVGIGSPGPLSRSERRLFQTANLPGFEGFPLGSRVEELCGLTVKLDNDAKCATFGEGRFGAAKGFKNYILMTFGTGIGGGIVCDGRMIYGKSDGACEVGHLTIYPEGRPCGCGNKGCFEQYASATAIGRKGADVFAVDNMTATELFAEQKNGDPRAETVLRSVAYDIAIATASFVNIFDPEAVIFGGGVFVEGGGPLLGWVSELIKTRCFESSQKNLQLIPSTLAGNAGMIGAATLILG